MAGEIRKAGRRTKLRRDIAIQSLTLLFPFSGAPAVFSSGQGVTGSFPGRTLDVPMYRPRLLYSSSVDEGDRHMNGIRRIARYAQAGLMFLVFVGGCSMSLPEYPLVSVDECVYRTEKDPVAVAVLPLTQKNEVKRYFGADLLDRGVLPVCVVVENASRTSSFVVDRSKVSLVGDEQKGQNDEDGKSDAGEVIATAGAVALVTGPLVAAPVGLLIGAKVSSDAQMVQQNMTAKQLDRHTVSPGETVQGFVYFDISRYGGHYPDAGTIRAELTKLGSGETYEMELTFDWGE